MKIKIINRINPNNTAKAIKFRNKSVSIKHSTSLHTVYLERNCKTHLYLEVI